MIGVGKETKGESGRMGRKWRLRALAEGTPGGYRDVLKMTMCSTSYLHENDDVLNVVQRAGRGLVGRGEQHAKEQESRHDDDLSIR